ncbi:hypothetical protein [Hymenobacter psychrotolerans]|uniref:Uncharacterized protein n=1 Tax=Hymenobacter psychrotolerans DSM 18569 TaxID=1121959 RepID=A0A1M6SWY4_9BACT|nr:hypothetical protein [Hymenobacter psychrotolerans]SHK49242.1 hypothetical protein SAMN02746009_01006 [Hymenobacter psychrotolerans DSM 18569]
MLAEGDYRYVGQLPAGPEGWVFTLYQSNKFDWVTAVDYELSYRGQLRAGPYLLEGRMEQAVLADYQAGRCGPILYLVSASAEDAARPGALYNTRWRPGYYDSLRFYGPDSLIRQLNSVLLKQVRQCQPEQQSE